MVPPAGRLGLVHDACGDAVGDLEGVDLLEAQVQLAVEGLARAPAKNKNKKKSEARQAVWLVGAYGIGWGETFLSRDEEECVAIFSRCCARLVFDAC